MNFMKKFFTAVICIISMLIFVSCIPENSASQNTVTVTVYENNVKKSDGFLAYMDGKTGDWKISEYKNGVYSFDLNSPDRNYSIYAANSYGTFHTIKIMNYNISDGNYILINFENNFSYTSDSTITLNLDNNFINTDTSLFYGSFHEFPDFSSENNLSHETCGLHSGTHDFIIVSGPKSGDPEKICIERNKTVLPGAYPETLYYSDLKDIDTYTATSLLKDVYVWGELFAGKSTPVFPYFTTPDKNLRLPDSLKSDDDLYLITLQKYNDISLSFEIYKTYPESTEIQNTLPSAEWEKPILSDNKTFSWKPYDSKIENHNLKKYEIITSDSLNSEWYITVSKNWLGDSSQYSYTLPDLSLWNSSWNPDLEKNSYTFSAVSGNENNVIKYETPYSGLEISTASYNINLH